MSLEAGRCGSSLRDASWYPPNFYPGFGSPLTVQYLANQDGHSHADRGRGTSEEMMMLLITMVTSKCIILRT